MVQTPAAQAVGVFFCGYHAAVQLSAHLAMWASVVFGLVCLGFAADGFLGLSAVADAGERDAAWSYAWFWTFLGVATTGLGVLYWKLLTGKAGQGD